jgi:hypothetical protein
LILIKTWNSIGLYRYPSSLIVRRPLSQARRLRVFYNASQTAWNILGHRSCDRGYPCCKTRVNDKTIKLLLLDLMFLMCDGKVMESWDEKWERINASKRDLVSNFGPLRQRFLIESPPHHLQNHLPSSWTVRCSMAYSHPLIPTWASPASGPSFSHARDPSRSRR